jgi:hypothetical protein
MKTNMKTKICLQSAAIFLTIALAPLAAAGTLVPFKGSLQGRENDTVMGNQLVVGRNVTGLATHLGKFNMVYNLTVILATGSSTGSAQLTAANGDMIFTTSSGRPRPRKIHRASSRLWK